MINFTYRKMLVLILVGLLIFAGCQPFGVEDENNQEYSYVKSVELTKSEDNLIKAAGVEKYFVFEFNVFNPDNKLADIWVDYYENGEFINKIASGGFSLTDNEGSGRILLTINDIPSESKQREFVTSLMQDDGFSSGSIVVNKKQDEVTSTWDKISERRIEFNDDMILAVMIEEEGENIIEIDKLIFEDNQEALRDVLQHDYVYILKSSFK